jgi:hypothetical protein
MAQETSPTCGLAGDLSSLTLPEGRVKLWPMMTTTPRLPGWALAFALAGGIFLPTKAAVAEKAIPSFVWAQSTDPLASEPGNSPGSFTIFRSGGSNDALTVAVSLGGTATNGVDYTRLPTSVTLAAGQLSTNLAVTPVSEPKSAGYKTVILTLPRPGAEGKPAVPAYVVGSLSRALVYIVYNYTNIPPSVSLVSPTNGSPFLSKPNLVLAAAASDSNGWVTEVRFFANGNSLGAVSNYPFGAFPLLPLVMSESKGSVMPMLPGSRVSRFQFVWTNVQPGAYSLTAAATDNAGLQTTSAPVNITVSTNLPLPQARIINPVNGATFPEQAPINLYAAAGETNGVVNTVEFFSNGNALGTATNYLATEPVGQAPFRMQWLPYNLQWTNAPVGTNILTAVATDNNGTKATSAPVTITVTTNLYHPRRPW